MHNLLTFSDTTFETQVENSEQLVIVDFWAPWCGPCAIVSPILENLAQKYEGKAVFGKINIDSNLSVRQKYNIRSIPTVLFLRKGEVVDAIVGAREINEYESVISNLLKE